jgi:hypothetical protein
MSASVPFAMKRHPKAKYTALIMGGFAATVVGHFSGEHTKKPKLPSFVASKVTYHISNNNFSSILLNSFKHFLHSFS